MPNPGDILYHKNFVFEDGSKGDKLFIVLNNVSGNDPYLVLKTTSQSTRYDGSTRGCNETKKVFFAPCSWQTCFDVDTYIQLPQIIEFSLLQILAGSSLGEQNIRILDNSISADCLAQLKNCLKRFKDDISEHHWKLIFSK